MKNAFKILSLYLTLALLTVGCQHDEDPQPACLKVEVMGADCDTNWYRLKIVDADVSGQQGNYPGQLQNGYVTTDNLPEAYRHAGMTLEVALEPNGEYGPRCVTIAVMYPAVKVTRVCQGEPATFK